MSYPYQPAYEHHNEDTPEAQAATLAVKWQTEISETLPEPCRIAGWLRYGFDIAYFALNVTAKRAQRGDGITAEGLARFCSSVSRSKYEAKMLHETGVPVPVRVRAATPSVPDAPSKSVHDWRSGWNADSTVGTYRD